MARRRPSPRRAITSGPVPGPDAFADLRSPDHVRSQAATLLLIGSYLRGDAVALRARAEAARPGFARSMPPTVDTIPTEDARAIGFPSLLPSPMRLSPRQLQHAAGVRFTGTSAIPSAGHVRLVTTRLRKTANAFYSQPNPETAGALLEVSLRHPYELVRVAAAASHVDVATEPRHALRVLERGVRSRDALVREVAACALAHLDPRNAALTPLLRPRMRRTSRRPSRTSLIVHGTWARGEAWWQPASGDFWKYLHDNVDPNVYGASDRFEWSGGYSDAARSLAGDELRAWALAHSLGGLDLFTHSHGGSVAMLANQGGLSIGRLVMLSCPVHWPKYAPEFSAVTKVVSVRVHLDLVILADRGGQRFHDSRIQENVLPLWFDHFATHDPANWIAYNIPARL